MSYLIRSFRTTRVAVLPSRSVASFHTSAVRKALSESDRAHPSDTQNRDAKIDTHKSDSIEKAKSGKGEWKPELASNSEQIAQADKHDMSMDEMQKMGEKQAEEGKTPSGSSSSKQTQ